MDPSHSKVIPGLALGAFLAAVTLLLNLPEIENFWRSPSSGSFDGLSHLVIGEYYARHIFPRTWGWAPHWFAGMPFPDFYPPLFYFVTALLSCVLPFSYAAVAKTFLVGLSLTLPGLTASVARAQTRRWRAGVSAGCLTVVFLSYENFRYGIALDATLKDGLFTQLPGYVCLLLWQRHFLADGESSRSRFLAKVFMFLLLLSNVHVVPVALLFIAIAALSEIVPCIRSRDFSAAISSLQSHAGMILMPLAAAAFWYVPLLWHSEYLATMTLPAMSVHEVSFIWVVPLSLTCITLLVSVVQRQHSMRTVALVCILLALTSTAAFTRLAPSLPLQPFRLFASFCFLTCIPMGYLFERLASSISRAALGWMVLVILLTPFAWDLAIDKAAAGRARTVFSRAPSDVLSSAEAGNDSTLTTVEVPGSLTDPKYLAVNGLLSQAGMDTTYIALRESSISSIFMTPLRNSLSKSSEAWGIETFLGFDSDFLAQPLNARLDRADYMGVGRFAVFSSTLSDRLERSGRAVWEGNLADARIYKLVRPALKAEVLQNEPAVFFGPVTFKKRSTWSYDYARLQEEIFFRGKFDTLVARAEDMFLDTSPDLDRFQTAIITGYRYHDLERALDRLRRYAESNTLICFTSSDPLFLRLATDIGAFRHILVFDRLQGEKEDVKPLRRQLQMVLSVLSNQSRPVTAAKTQSVRSVQFTGENIKVRLHDRTAVPVPVLVKASYFPYWHRSDSKEPVYMITPTYMLTYAQSDFALNVSADASVWVGFLISLLAVGLAFVTTMRSAVSRRLGYRRS